MLRTHTCGELRRSHIDSNVTLCGWVDTVRVHSPQLIFLNLRDRYGLTQVRLTAGTPGYDVLTKEATVRVHGVTLARPAGTENPKLDTGEVEVEATSIELIGACKPLPFEIRNEITASEDLRLEYRYLDLRRRPMLDNLIARHRITAQVRSSLNDMGFLEIETPMFVKSTPEGSRDFIVPSRLYPGKFYALPQSPQLYKQILMTAGVDRYYSTARCFRDEDPRRGRQLVHTQIDLEMSFAEQEDVFAVVERFLSETFQKVIGVTLPTPFPHHTYDEVIDRWGIDKPDLRFGLEIADVTSSVLESGPDAILASLREGAVARAIAVPGVAATYSRKTMTELDEFVARYQLGRLLSIKVNEDGPKASFGANAPGAIARIVESTGAKSGDQILIATGPYKRVSRALGELRNHLGRQLDLIPADTYRPLWVTEFPMFDQNEETGRWEAMHHMFTMPKREHLPFLTERPGDVRAQLYDVVLNGVELGSGSVRITDPVLQQRIMEFVGYERERAEQNFGFFLRSFEYGAPVQAGIALGLDNLVMTMLGLDNLREVIAFPNNTAGVNPLDDSPTPVEPEQLAETHLSVLKR